MTEQISQRISKQLGLANLTELLAEEVSGADLHSLLLSVFKRRVKKIEPSKLTNPSSATKSCDLDGRMLNRLESLAFEAASEFAALELSPLAPLGAVATLSGLDQGNVLSTIRAFECASDPTVGLALECARRRKEPAERKNITRLCTNQRVVRFPLPENPAYTAHFKLFSMVSAGRAQSSFAFEAAELREHIGVYLKLLAKLNTVDFAFEDIAVQVSDTRAIAHLCALFNISRDDIRSTVRARDASTTNQILEKYSVDWPKTMTNPSQDLEKYNLPTHTLTHLELLQQAVFGPLSTEHSGVRFEFNMHRLTGLGYYDGHCFHIKVKNNQGQEFALADGGFVTWTQQLLGDTKERLMTSAIGTELMCRLFRR